MEIMNCPNVVGQHCTTILPYSYDLGTGRCRFTKMLLELLKIQVGWILRLQIIVSERISDICCVVWPDISHQLKNDEICFDDSILFPHSSPISSISKEFRVKVISFQPPAICKSFYFDKTVFTEEQGDSYFDLKSNMHNNALFLGLPVFNDAKISLKRKYNISSSIRCSRVSLALIAPHFRSHSSPPSPPSFAIITSDTLLLHSPSPSPSSSPSNSSVSSLPPSPSSAPPLPPAPMAGLSVVSHLDSLSLLPSLRLHHSLSSLSSSPDLLSSTTPCPILSSALSLPSLALTEDERRERVREAVRGRERSLIRGVLLSGPPGTGKTYSLRALQARAKERAEKEKVDVRIFPVDLPALLSSDQPVQALLSVLNEAVSFGTNSYSLPTFHTPPSPPIPSTSESPVNSTNPCDSTTTTTTTIPSPSLPPSVSTPTKKFSFLSNLSSPTPSTPSSSSSSSTKNKNSSSKKSSSSSSSSSRASLSPADFLKARSSLPPSPAPVSSPLLSPPSLHLTDPNPLPPPPHKPLRLSLLLLDEMDLLGPGPGLAGSGSGREGGDSEAQSALKAVLFRFLDGLSLPPFDPPSQSSSSSVGFLSLLLVATSNRPDSLDKRWRRGGRIEREIPVHLSSQDRSLLYQSLIRSHFHSPLSSLPLSSSSALLSDFASFASDKSGGYVSADIAAISAHMWTNYSSHSSSSSSTSSPLSFSELVRLWEEAVGRGRGVAAGAQSGLVGVGGPACLRGATVEVPKLSWSDVVGCEEAKKLIQRVLAPCQGREVRERMKRFGLLTEGAGVGGLLLHGPPGNSKTRLVLAAASSLSLPLLSLSPADVYSPYVGDAEGEVRRVFALARRAAPCLLLLDEMDALVGNRMDGGSSVSPEARILATLLTEMDGIGGPGSSAGMAGEGDELAGMVIVFATTNRLSSIDAALLRKGRFEHLIHIPPPSPSDQLALLEYFSTQYDLQPRDSVVAALKCRLREGISGAEIQGLCKEQAMNSLRSHISSLTLSP